MRIQVNLSDEMIKRCDDYATKMGLSRSAFCASMIGQSVMSLDKGNDLFEALKISMPNLLEKSGEQLP